MEFELDPARVPQWVPRLIRYLGAQYPAWQPTELAPFAYLDVLGDLDPEDIKAAAQAYAREDHAFAPSAGQLRALAVKARRARAGHGPDCGCLDCIAKLPEWEKWDRLDPRMRETLEREVPDQAARMKQAARQLAERVLPGVGGLLDEGRKDQGAAVKRITRLAVLIAILGIAIGFCGSEAVGQGNKLEHLAKEYGPQTWSETLSRPSVQAHALAALGAPTRRAR